MKTSSSPFAIALRPSPIQLVMLLVMHVLPVGVVCMASVPVVLCIVTLVLACVSGIRQFHLLRRFGHQILRFGAEESVLCEDVASGQAEDVCLLPESRDLGGWLLLLCWQGASGQVQRFVFMRDAMPRGQWQCLRRTVRWSSSGMTGNAGLNDQTTC